MRPPDSQFLPIVTLALGVIACAPPAATAPDQRISLTPIASPTGPNAAEPFVSVSDKGILTLSWLQREADSVTVSLRVASADSTGTWGRVAEIVKSTGLFVNWADFPSVVPLRDGRLLAHWLQRNGTGKYNYDVRIAQSTDQGSTWSEGVTPHGPGIPAEHGFVTLLPRADSSADILFLNGSPAPPAADGHEGHGPPMQLALNRWTAAGAMQGQESTLDTRTCDCCQTAAAVTAKGPVILYRDRSETENRDIAIQRHVNGAWTTPVPLHADGWTINACPVNGPAISAAGDRVAAVWFTGARDTAKVQLKFSDDAGATFGEPIRIDGGQPSGRVDVELLESGEALVTWIERTGKESAEVRARIVRRDGTAEPALMVAALSGGRATGFPRMARRGARDVVLAWTVPGTPSIVRLASLTVAPR